MRIIPGNICSYPNCELRGYAYDQANDGSLYACPRKRGGICKTEELKQGQTVHIDCECPFCKAGFTR